MSSNDHVCGICLEDFKTPKILKCFHTFCLHCLETLVNKTSRNNIVKCPMCHKSIKIPHGGVSKFSSNFYIKDNTTQNICPIHKQKEVDIYCVDCAVAVCSKCVVSGHRRHHFLDLDLEETQNIVKEELECLKTELRNNMDTFKKHSNMLKNKLSEIQVYGKSAIDIVDKHVENYCNRAIVVGQMVKVEIAKTVEEDNNKLNGLIKDLDELIGKIQANIRKQEISPADNTRPCIVQIIRAIPEVREMKAESKSRKLDNPVIRYPWFKENMLPNQPLSLQQLVGTLEMLEGPGFTATLNLDQICENRKFFSPDYQSVQGMTWRVVVSKWSCASTSALALYLYLAKDDNGISQIQSCDVSFTIKLMNHKNKCYSVCKKRERKFTPGGLANGWVDFMDWNMFTGSDAGFLDANKNFTVQVAININNHG